MTLNFKNDWISFELNGEFHLVEIFTGEEAMQKWEISSRQENLPKLGAVALFQGEELIGVVSFLKAWSLKRKSKAVKV